MTTLKRHSCCNITITSSFQSYSLVIMVYLIVFKLISLCSNFKWYVLLCSNFKCLHSYTRHFIVRFREVLPKVDIQVALLGNGTLWNPAAECIHSAAECLHEYDAVLGYANLFNRQWSVGYYYNWGKTVTVKRLWLPNALQHYNGSQPFLPYRRLEWSRVRGYRRQLWHRLRDGESRRSDGRAYDYCLSI